jgi:hypothetical protein
MTTLLITPEHIAIDTRGTTDQSTDDGVQKWHNIPNLGLIGFLVGSAATQFELITRLRNGEAIETASERMKKQLPRYRQMFFLNKEGQIMQFIPSTAKIIPFTHAWAGEHVLTDGSGMATVKGAYARLGKEDLDGVFLANSIMDKFSAPSYWLFDRSTQKASFHVNDKAVAKGLSRVSPINYERFKALADTFNAELN